MTELHKENQNNKQAEILNSIEEIENCKDDSTKMFKTIRNMMRDKLKKTLMKTAEGITCNEKQAMETIIDFFEEMFSKENENIDTVIPQQK